MFKSKRPFFSLSNSSPNPEPDCAELETELNQLKSEKDLLNNELKNKENEIVLLKINKIENQLYIDKEREKAYSNLPAPYSKDKYGLMEFNYAVEELKNRIALSPIISISLNSLYQYDNNLVNKIIESLKEIAKLSEALKTIYEFELGSLKEDIKKINIELDKKQNQIDSKQEEYDDCINSFFGNLSITLNKKCKKTKQNIQFIKTNIKNLSQELINIKYSPDSLTVLESQNKTLIKFESMNSNLLSYLNSIKNKIKPEEKLKFDEIYNTTVKELKEYKSQKKLKNMAMKDSRNKKILNKGKIKKLKEKFLINRQKIYKYCK